MFVVLAGEDFVEYDIVGAGKRAAPQIMETAAHPVELRQVDAGHRVQPADPVDERAGRHRDARLHVNGLPEDEVETGTIFVRRSGGKNQFRIDFTDPNAYSVVIRGQPSERGPLDALPCARLNCIFE